MKFLSAFAIGKYLSRRYQILSMRIKDYEFRLDLYVRRVEVSPNPVPLSKLCTEMPILCNENGLPLVVGL